MPAGQPTKYRKEFAKQAAKLCELGATNAELADFFEVSTQTIYNWSAAHKEFFDALKAGKESADERVERSLFQRAVGYSFDSEKIFNAGGEPLKVPYREHIAPDTTAQIFWLKNRRRDQWRDKQDLEHTGKDGGPIETASRSDRDLAKAIAAVLARGLNGGD